jgi:hypothetical protein
MAAGDGELIREEVAAEQVLMPEAIAVGSSLKRVLDVEVRTTVQIPGLHGDEERCRWCSTASKAAGEERE